MMTLARPVSPTEYATWLKRALSTCHSISWWADDGIHTGVHAEREARQGLLVIIGVTPEGKQGRVTIGDGRRTSTPS
ncbi:MAG: hypothetical protein ACUVT0_00620 [Thermochromatium sp.]